MVGNTPSSRVGVGLLPRLRFSWRASSIYLYSASPSAPSRTLMAYLLSKARFRFPRTTFILYFLFALQVQGYTLGPDCDGGKNPQWETAVQLALIDAMTILTLAKEDFLKPRGKDNTRDTLFSGTEAELKEARGK
jgi:hypothetical protein